jgi:cyclase
MISRCWSPRHALQALSVLILSFPVHMTGAAQQPEEIRFETVELAAGLYVLASNQGGNVAVSVGSDGVLVIDGEMSHVSPALRNAISGLTDREVRFILNTHWHFDHVGGNRLFGQDGAIIVAHDNVRRRMAAGQTITALDLNIPPAHTGALPILTFSRDVTIHWNGDVLEVIHPDPAHTDGDAIIYFRNANVVHMGDLFWNGVFPLIDGSSGGSTAGMIAAVATVLERADDNTRIIPGHGPVGSKEHLRDFLDMLVTANDRIHQLRNAGMTIDEVVAAKPLAEFDSQWGGGFLKTDQWVRIIYTTP